MGRYAGMDVGVYLGRRVTGALQAATNIVWTGLYLDSPAPVPGENTTPPPPPPARGLSGHNRYGSTAGDPPGSWMRGATDLSALGLGCLPIYWGQQDLRNAQGPWDLRVEIAEANGKDAVVKAGLAGIPRPAVIYLDWEGANWIGPEGLAYCTTWFASLAEEGYRPGIYSHAHVALALRCAWPGLFTWIARPSVFTEPDETAEVFDLARLPELRIHTPSLAGCGEPDAVAWQWAWVWSPRVWPVELTAAVPDVPSQLDFNCSTVGDPARPEARLDPREVRQGSATALPGCADTLDAIAVRRGRPTVVSCGFAGQQTVEHSVAPGRILLNPWAPLGTIPTTRVPGNTAAAFALGRPEEGPDNLWQVYRLQLQGDAWRLEDGIGGGSIAIEPLAGVTAVARQSTSVVDAFVVSRQDGQLYNSWQKDGRWSTWTPVDSGQPFEISRAAGIAAVSRGQGKADVFVIGADDRRLYTIFSTTPGRWSRPFPIGGPELTVHPLARVTAVSRLPSSLDAFTIGRLGPGEPWRLCDTWWWVASGWGNVNRVHTQVIGGCDVTPHPLGGIAAVSRRPDTIDVFVSGMADGLLYHTCWEAHTNRWAPFRQVGGAVAVATVDVAISCPPDGVAVLVTGRDGEVYMTSRPSDRADFAPLARLASLSPS